MQLPDTLIESLEQSYKDMQWMREHHPLRQLFWECTLRCNLSCRHCGSDCKRDDQRPEMPLADFLPVLDEVRAHQPDIPCYVHTVGGEPLVRKDILDCGAAITERGFLWGMVSNGMLIDAAMMRELMQAGLKTIALSLDGNSETHNWLRRNERSFDRVFHAIEQLKRQEGLLWDVITCVHRNNIHQLATLKRMLVEAGVRKWRIFTIFPVGRASQDSDLVLTDEEYRNVLDFIVYTRREGLIDVSYSCEGFLGEYEGHVRNHNFQCQAGLMTASVLSDGGISGCLSIRSSYQQGNIYKESFWDVWEHAFQPYRDHEWMRTGECADCKVFKYCQGNGMHLRADDGSLLHCNYNKLQRALHAAQN